MIVHFHRKDPLNLGDWFSNPLLYFDFGQHIPSYDLFEYKKITLDNPHLIFGGGGLFGHKKMHRILTHLVQEMPHQSVTYWGAGHNFKSHRADELLWPDYVTSADLIGIRDYIKDQHWVPCASCMHTAFDQHYEIKHDTVVYRHKRVAMDLEHCDYPVMTNAEQDIGNIIAFLASGRTVITNSYHGAYWATLLGRNVKIFNWNVKFDYFRHAPTVIDHVQDVKPFSTHDNILELYRERNRQFYLKVLDRIN